MTPKFRAWDENGKRYEGSEVCLIGELVIKSSYSATRWEEEAQLFNLCQYTGLKDKNGAEVYFNDIVEDEYGHRYEVVFEGDCLRCNGIRRIRGGYKPKNRWFDRDLKIIGNIYENSELKEVSE